MDFKTYNFWDIIKELDWVNLCKDETKKPYIQARIKLDKIVGNNDRWLSEIKSTVVAYRRILQEKLREYSLKVYGERYIFPSISDDSLWDLTAHIVGCGKEDYEYVMNDPAYVLCYLDTYKENFEYTFCDKFNKNR